MNTNTNNGNNRRNGSNRNGRSNRNIVNNNTSGVSFDSLYRGYSIPHSNFDDEFNMDFEYGYLNLMTNMHTFIRKAQTIYSRMESRISSIVETQTERRRIIEWNRDHNINGNLLNSHESQNMHGSTNSYVRSGSNSDNDNTRVEGDNDNDNDNDEDDDDDDDNDGGDNNNDNIPQYVPIHPDPNNIHVNVANEQGNRNFPNTRNVRNMGNIDVFDFISIVPRAPLNRNTGGISIRQIEENSEIMLYSSIPTNDILNTECPITRESFQPNSLVLRLTSCHHCFIPFRIMNWLETHSTCPLCRGTVISNPPTNDDENRENRENRENIENNINNRSSTRNTSLNGSDISDNYMDISNNPVDISNIYNRLLTNNIFNNLSIEDRNNNSIVFSFDLPERQDNNVNNVNYRNSYIYPRLERLFSNYNTHDTSGNINTSTNTNTNNNSENNGGNHNNYPSNDYDEVD